MIIGVPREVKQDEHRVGLVPAGAYSLVKAGHQVLVEQGAGLGSGISDANYTSVGAQIVIDRDELFAQADMIVKVKEPLPPEYRLRGRFSSGAPSRSATRPSSSPIARSRFWPP